jgi:hypothetical protein
MTQIRESYTFIRVAKHQAERTHNPGKPANFGRKLEVPKRAWPRIAEMKAKFGALGYMLVEDWESKNFNGYNIDRKFIDQVEQQSQLMTSLENRLTDAERKEAELQARIAELQAQLEGSKKVRNQKQTTDGNQ